MKSPKDQAEESLRRLMSRRFETYEKEPSAQLTRSVFDTLGEIKRDRAIRVILTCLLILCISTVGGFLYIGKQKVSNIENDALSTYPPTRTKAPVTSEIPQNTNKPMMGTNLLKISVAPKSEISEDLEIEGTGVKRLGTMPITYQRAKQYDRRVVESKELTLKMDSSELAFKNQLLAILNNRPVSMYAPTFKVPEPTNSPRQIPTAENNGAPRWKLTVGIIPTTSFQTIRIIPREGLIYQNFRFSEPVGVRNLGYKLQAGLERNGMQFLVSYSRFSHSVTYEVAGNEFILVPNALNGRTPVRKAKTVHDQNLVEQIGIGLKRHFLFAKGALQTHYFDIGFEATNQIGSKNHGLWLNAAFGREFRVLGNRSLAIGPYFEYSLRKFENAGRVYLSTPYQVGASVGLRFSK